MKLRAVSLKRYTKFINLHQEKKRKGQKKIGNKKGEVTTDTTETPRIIRDYYSYIPIK